VKKACLLLAVVLLTACGKPRISEEDNKYMVTGAFGERLDLRDADEIECYGDDLPFVGTPDDALLCGMYRASYRGFAYAAKSAGIFYTTVDNPEKFTQKSGNANSYDFNENIPREYKYFRVKNGDKFGGLTVEKTSYSFYMFNGKIDMPVVIISYDGEVTMKGYIVDTDGDLTFVPDAGTIGDLPAVTELAPLRCDNFDGVSSLSSDSCYSDVRSIYLGSIGLFYKDTDFSDVPFGDGYVTVTLKDLLIGSGSNSAILVSVKAD